MTREAARRVRASSGYSLVELLVGVAILSIVASAGLPHVDTRRELINTSVQSLIADLRLTRARAITSGSRHALAFSNSSTYELQRLELNAAGVWALERVVKTTALPENIRVAFPDTPDGRIEFNTRGMMISSPQPLWPAIMDVHHHAKHHLAIWPSGQIYQED